MHQPAIHVTDNNNGVMSAYEMFSADKKPMHFACDNYLAAAQMYLENHYPGLRFTKSGWSANLTQAIYHFCEVLP